MGRDLKIDGEIPKISVSRSNTVIIEIIGGETATFSKEDLLGILKVLDKRLDSWTCSEDEKVIEAIMVFSHMYTTHATSISYY